MGVCVLYQGEREQRDKQQIRMLLLFELQRTGMWLALSLYVSVLKWDNKLFDSFTTQS